MKESKIEWTDHTFNPWWGCMKVSAGCKNCYAETLDNRWKGGHWGSGSSRKMQSDKYWQQPLEWDKAAAAAGIKAKVFCASMADVFEHHPDNHPELWMERQRLFLLITQTPNLIWQLLTKRPQNIMKLIPESWEKGLPENVWIGTSVENQEAAEERIPTLLNAPAKVRFLSCEPLLGALDISSWLYPKNMVGMEVMNIEGTESRLLQQDIHWVIAGGESGHGARPMHPDWARSLRDQCKAAGIAYFFKQWGEYLPYCQLEPSMYDKGNPVFKPVSFPSPHNPGKVNTYFKAGKGKTGRLLDGVEHNEFPNIRPWTHSQPSSYLNAGISPV